jgi:cyclophilin family peptidyl-prolyl cis-trans isomerase/protein-disulfide isomerase
MSPGLLSRLKGRRLGLRQGENPDKKENAAGMSKDHQGHNSVPITLAALSLLLSILAGCSGNPQQSTSVAATTSGQQAPSLGPTSTASATIPSPPTGEPTATLAPIPTAHPAERLAGSDEAPLELLVYSDFDCDLCAQVYSDLIAVIDRHPDRISYIFRPFPLLGVHANSAQATAAFIAARDLGAGSAMHDWLFEHRLEWMDLEPADFRAWLLKQAPEMGLEADALAAAMADPETLSAIEGAFQAAQASGIPGVPFLFINGQSYLLEWSEENLEASVRLALLRQNQIDEPPEMTAPTELPTQAEFQFNLGTLEVQLYPRSAPQALSSFVYLSQQGWYRDTALYQVLPGNLVMGGDPTNTGLGNAGYHFEVEIDPVRTFDQAGILALDNGGPASNSSRYLITLAPRPDLEGSYTVIGRVIDGMSWLQQLAARDPLPDLLQPAEAILERIVFDY